MATTNIELWLPVDDAYQPALLIPVETCQYFSVHPLAWLRYIGYTIYGNEGTISTSVDGPEVDYYEVEIQPGIYYYVSQDPCLLDPDAMEDRSTMHTMSVSTRRGDFRASVIARDRNCVMVGPATADACHIIPHAKGDEYLVNLINHRHEVLDPPLNSINDTRNGILLSKQLHAVFGASEVAFLQTPNFAMTVNDVDLVMQPTAARVGFTIQPSDAESRLTFQHFNNHDLFVSLGAPHNSDARQSNSNEWPPPIIFDIAYGCAALKTWGEPNFKNTIWTHTRNIYYTWDDEGSNGNGGDRPGKDNSNLEHIKQIQARNERADRRAQRRAQSEAGGQNTQVDDIQVVDMIVGLWMRNARQRKDQKGVKADSTQKKVQAWLESTR